MNFTLDHVAVVVPDLDAASDAWRRLGFQLTRKSSHSGPLPGGGTGLWGTGNRCAMFERGYFEILGITDPSLPHDNVARRLARYAGLHLIAFGTDDAKGAVADLRAAGVPGIADPIPVGRDVPFGDGTRPGRFGIAYLDAGVYPEADFILIEQETPDVLWQPDLLTQPNGVVSLRSVTIASDDPAASRRRLAAILGAPDGDVFRLASGFLEVLGPEGIGSRYQGVDSPLSLPKVVGVSFGVRDLDKTARALSASGVPFTATPHAVRVGPDHASGAAVEFVEEPRR